MATVLEVPRFTSDRRFYLGMGGLAALIVAVGFAPTFYLRGAALPALPLLLVVHGTVFTSWIALFIVQGALVAADRRDIHRKLGVLGAFIAAAMVILGFAAGVDAMRLGHAPVQGLDPRSFLAIPVRAIAVFAILVGAAVWFRKRADTHKRLMLLATLNILDAAIARWPVAAITAYGPPAFYGILDLLIIGCMIRDKRRHGSVHRAYKWGAGLIFVSQPLFLALSGSPPWFAFADALK